ncbi:MAG: hypothetical protein HC933_20115 [Pleurocapsa sp. SU_196_0]|nr:hypothetical protein [Pleurocapsa sp. SU_196_0]
MRPIDFQGTILATSLGIALHTLLFNMAPKLALFAAAGVVGAGVVAAGAAGAAAFNAAISSSIALMRVSSSGVTAAGVAPVAGVR